MIVNNSYLITEDLLPTVELGSMIFDSEAEKMYMVLEAGKLKDINIKTIPVKTLEELVEAIAAGGVITIKEDIDAPTGFAISADTTIVNDKTLSISEDVEGNGVFMVTNGTLTLDGKGTVNGLDKSGWSMAVWAKENGKVIINDGYFTNVGAFSEEDGEHFDLIYASDNAYIEINGGEFKCETPKWTVNIKDNSRETAKITIKGGKFHGFNPATSDIEGENTNFLAPGYKVVEETENVFVVIPE